MYQPVIGLEIHLQLKTKSKMFCSCDNRGEYLEPNTTICPICTGQPGTLPVPNQQAAEWAVKTALALNCQINKISKFDRKHYFYPDLPKGYQISQYDLPVGEKGFVEIETKEGEEALDKLVEEEIHGTEKKSKPLKNKKKIRLIRMHMEEDAAKNIHLSGDTLVDFNRAGTPLVEIVTEPDISSSAEAKTFLQELQTIARFLHISDADMEKGHLRCDVNVSLRPEGDTKFYPKTEIKNLNSFKAVERAIEYEIKRQSELWDKGDIPEKLTTRGWNDAKQITEEQRVKEGAEDYRYLPEPDIPAFDLTKIAERAQANLPELPAQTRNRFVEEYGLSKSDARILTSEPEWAEFTENVFSEAWEWLTSLPEMEGTEDEIMDKNRARLGKLVGGWLTSKLMGLMAENKIDIKILKITPENFAEFISLIYTNKINSANAQLLLAKMLEAGGDPSIIMEENKLGQVKDDDLISKAVDNVIKMNPDQVEQYKNGKVAVIQFLIGKVMKETQGQVDPQTAKEMLEEKLK
ncbi:MAG: glutamyl-tRNA(Gln) and/or aspartyl-tRNA(Asn) amidotransferase, B subunit [Candidatus Magasanikbacteria bacterium GW2011_GWC2_40_17]|uniref:Aspartyl/glutamyl-tRNA(Asn/Gln) amidotransferase subunit B n=1 Tax=Candidatus Magasanikbacteria bacterium GW2011_GWA2_42_32 TaxID=1619039 RepID=A0A0G1CF30_9BACT|nr:MAG: glutamyl-tRNA(Gln) and/or aspartyl-tRNA(Asn) amidotransferase, B subunit [Candidatus Magasanikbacteria bacterium GW2011_GWC2_40_17]KKS57176.1 MAG: glutamyl-tRNA(Gln) and/or aspartyl-tRNA(Asn) amidotransferase, B subunit [Candidatus Magasanikbacteria bacterium GW2011_GWA2_42_32]OGH85304.1 MAG: glutaminyl-tRNA synthase (glutamine-hydrolyzing) subunit B [Candidatus Magasanikbacteria bacterium RIFOXYB2_FULL_38_10]